MLGDTNLILVRNGIRRVQIKAACGVSHRGEGWLGKFCHLRFWLGQRSSGDAWVRWDIAARQRERQSKLSAGTLVMKKSSNWRTPLFTRRVLVTLVCAAVCSFASATLLAFFRPEAPTKVFHRALTFEERVGYQRTIEEVYWCHRIWPKECPDPRPSLDTVMSRAQLAKKVEDYLRNSQALEHHWQRPITAEQLQAEMNRMATHTKQPDVLRELFEALGNDPFVVAECLARPALTERVLTSSYAYDQRIHGWLRQRADSDLVVHPAVEQMKQTSGTYSEIDLVRSNGSQKERQRGTEHAFRLNNGEWDETVRKLAATFSKRTGLASGQRQNAAAEDYESIPVGELSALQEDETGYYATAVTEKAEDRLKLATVMWSKEPVQSWRARVEKQLPYKIAEVNASYTLPAVSAGAGGCANDTWAASSLNTPTPRYVHTAVWTGSEMIIWGGGFGDPFTPTNTGGRYNPSTDAWTTMTTVNAPSPRGGHSAVWTGNQMIVWGGGWLNDGGRYDPTTDTWLGTNTSNAPIGRSGHTAVWTGSEMIVWAGSNNSGDLNSGGRYNPTTNSWTAISITNAPIARDYHTAVWTGSEMIVWGGLNHANDQCLNTGGKYSPATDSWTATNTTNAPYARELHAAIWTGSKMIAWGGINFSDPANLGPLNTGAEYDPGTNSWTATSTIDAPDGRYYHTAVWTGSEIIVWGGQTSNGFVNTGGRYNPNTSNWTATSTANAPPQRLIHSAVWTGSEMIVWGGQGGSQTGALNTGGRYNPSTDTWAPNQPPTARIYHTVVWTGSEMIVWGGLDGYFNVNSGGRYNLATDAWTSTSTVNAPSGRSYHTGVWTGTEMIVWGGSDSKGELNSGGRYNPGMDTWTATSSVNVPVGRAAHAAVWTGSEMIVWGGTDGYNTMNSGGRYNPSMDTWTATSTTGAPSARDGHTAVWTSNEMIIWGGSPDTAVYQNALNTGGRYNPGTDSWTASSTNNAPSARVFHTAVWTGSDMIIWGGATDSNFTSFFDTGGRYNPSGDTWTNTSNANVPTGRADHAAVWTGNEMIVWGGSGNSAFQLDTGSKYDPDSDSWTATSTSGNTATARYLHTAVWSGSEMIVWGGLDTFGYTNSGGRYCGESGPPQLSSGMPVVSRMTHGSAGTFDINLPLTGTRGVECRSGGASGNYTLVFTFANNLTSVGSASLTTHNPANGTGSVSSSAIGPNSNQYTVNLAGVSTGQYITVTLNSVVDMAGNSGNVTGPQMGVLIGDSNQDGFVNSADISQTKAQSGGSVTINNFREDLNTDGFLNSGDISLVKSKSGTALPSSP
jgi:N-acetylneuraminic acid mutarotase